ncbi:hypothetical protein ACWF94_16275 [Streptomyces sp. NPDC055078]
MRRRTFITAATGVTVAVTVPSHAVPRRVGHSDVDRLAAELTVLKCVDDDRGGHAALEGAALAGASVVLTLQEGNASGAVKRRLFGLAADYTALAGWSCTDNRELDRAQSHLERAMTLAGMSRDPATQFRIWNNVSIVAAQRKRFGDALAAAQVIQTSALSRRDPLFASLAHTRAGAGHAEREDRQAALRSIGQAEDALTRASAQERPSWMAFYGPGELLAVTAGVHLQLGDPEEAECAIHKSLARIPQHFRRNRAMGTARLARAQLHQGDVEQSYETATTVFGLMDGTPLPGRMRVRIGDYHRDLLELAPQSAQARDWTELMPTKVSRIP